MKKKKPPFILAGIVVALLGFVGWTQYTAFERSMPKPPPPQPAQAKELKDDQKKALAGEMKDALKKRAVAPKEMAGGPDGPMGGPPGGPGSATVVAPEPVKFKPNRTDSMTSGGWYTDQSAENPETRIPTGKQ